MVRTFLLAMLISTLAGTIVLAEPLAWKAAAAPARLLVERPYRPHSQLLVPVPSEWSDTYRGVLAFTNGGEALPASPVLAGDKLLAVAVNARGHFTVKPPPVPDQPEIPPAQPGLAIYLFAEPPAQALPYDRLGMVTVDRQVRALTTRAFTAQEMMRLFSTSGRRRGRPLTALVDDFGLLPDRGQWSHFPENRNAAAMLQWEASWVAAENTAVAFGADQTHTAWTILVNGRVAASWQNGVPRPGGGAFGSVLHLEPGIHTVQMLVVQKPEEALPACLVRTPDGNPAGERLTDLLPAFRPEWLGAEINGQPEKAMHAVITPDTTYSFRPTDQAISAFTVTTEADGISRSYVNRQGQNLSPTADNLLLCPAGETPTATLSKGQVTLTIPGREHWQAGAMLSGRLRLDDLPPVLPHAQPLPLSLRLEWQDMPPEQVLQNLTVTATQVNAGGADLDTAQTAVTITSAGAIPLLTLPLADACRQVIITCGLPGHHVLTPLTLIVLHPGDNLHGLNAKGNNLFQHGRRAVLVCHPLPKTPLANAPTPSFRTSNPLRIAVLDDFMATATAPGAELLPETVMTAVLQQDGFSPQITRVPAANLPGTSSRLAPWKALAAAHDLRPDVIVLAVGTLPLADAIEPREWSSHLLFAVQSSLAAGIAPALVALPALPAVDPARGRLAALYTKEIGLAMGLPVFDLYSRRKVDAGRLSRWFQPGRPAATSPDDDARHWLATATAQAFLRHYHPDQVNP